jgi:hypothetical protein
MFRLCRLNALIPLQVASIGLNTANHIREDDNKIYDVLQLRVIFQVDELECNRIADQVRRKIMKSRDNGRQ